MTADSKDDGVGVVHDAPVPPGTDPASSRAQSRDRAGRGAAIRLNR